MGRYKKSDFRPAMERIDALPPQEREAVYREAETIIREHLLREVRAAVAKSQKDVASKLNVAQPEISRLENAADAQVSTLQRYIKALGGELHLVAHFPNGRDMRIGLHGGKPVKSRIEAAG